MWARAGAGLAGRARDSREGALLLLPKSVVRKAVVDAWGTSLCFGLPFIARVSSQTMAGYLIYFVQRLR